MGQMELPPNALNIIIVLSIAAGAVQCFFGFRIFKIILGILGFALGGAFSCGTVYAVSQQAVISLLAGFIGGVIGAAFMVVLYFIGIFLLGAFFGVVLGVILYGLANCSPEPAGLIILALIAGTIAVLFQKCMIIVSTAFSGAWNVVAGTGFFITGSPGQNRMEHFFRPESGAISVVVFAWLVLGILGVMVQYKFAPKGAGKVQSPPRQDPEKHPGATS